MWGLHRRFGKFHRARASDPRRILLPQSTPPSVPLLHATLTPPVHLPNGRRDRRFVPRAWTPRHWTAFRLPRAAPPPLPNPTTPSPGQHRASTHATLPHCLPPVPFSPESSSPVRSPAIVHLRQSTAPGTSPSMSQGDPEL